MSRTVSALYSALAIAGALFATPAFAQAPNLAVSFTVPTSAPLAWGAGGTYTINIVNNGDATAAAPELTATLPALLALGKVTGCTMTEDITDPANPTLVFPCVLADIPAGETATVKIAVDLDPNLEAVPTTCPAADSVGPVTVDVTDADDSDTTDNTATLSAADNALNPIANLTVEATGPTSAGSGSALTFNVLVTNNGPCVATNVVATNVVAYGQATAVSASGTALPADACAATPDGTEVDCNLGDMALTGETSQIAYTVDFQVGNGFASDLLKATDYFDFGATSDATDVGGASSVENAVTIDLKSASSCSTGGGAGGLLVGALALLFLARRRRVTA